MKAVVLEAKDKPLVYKEVETPGVNGRRSFGEDKSSSFKPRDYWITVVQYAGIKYPSILGSDGSGIVAEVGSDADKHGWIRSDHKSQS